MALWISSPCSFTHFVYGVSFSVANFFAISSETCAVFSSFAMSFPSSLQTFIPSHLHTFTPSRRLLDLSREELLPQLGRARHAGPVFRRVLELLEVVEAARLVDAVHRGDEPHGPVGI